MSLCLDLPDLPTYVSLHSIKQATAFNSLPGRAAVPHAPAPPGRVNPTPRAGVAAHAEPAAHRPPTPAVREAKTGTRTRSTAGELLSGGRRGEALATGQATRGGEGGNR